MEILNVKKLVNVTIVITNFYISYFSIFQVYQYESRFFDASETSQLHKTRHHQAQKRRAVHRAQLRTSRRLNFKKI